MLSATLESFLEKEGWANRVRDSVQTTCSRLSVLSLGVCRDPTRQTISIGPDGDFLKPKGYFHAAL